MPTDFTNVLRPPAYSKQDTVYHVVIEPAEREGPTRVSTPIWVWGLLRAGPRSAEELASELGCGRQVIYNVIWRLRCHGVIIEREGGKGGKHYGRKGGKYYLAEDRPLAVAPGWPGLKLAHLLTELPEQEAKPPRREGPNLKELAREVRERRELRREDGAVQIRVRPEELF